MNQFILEKFSSRNFYNLWASRQYRLAKEISVPQRRISEIVQGKRAISAETVLRLGRYFAMEAQFSRKLQSRYELLRVKSVLGERLDKEMTPHAA